MVKHSIVLPGGEEISSGTAGAVSVRRVKHTALVNSGTELCLGSACADCVEVELWAPEGAQPVAAGDEIAVYRAIDGGEPALVGRFLCEKPTKASANVYRVTAYDRMTRFDADASGWLRKNQGAFPLTLFALAQQACAQCGVTLATAALPRNGGYGVRAFYADDITWRQIVGWVAEAAGTYAHMTPEGALAFGWYTDLRGAESVAPHTSRAGDTLLLAQPDGRVLTGRDGVFLQPRDARGRMHGYFGGSLSYEDYETAGIDKVQIKRSSDDVGVIYPAEETGTNAYVIEGNLLLTTDTDAALRPVAAALFEFLKDVRYTPFTASLRPTGDIPAGSMVYVCDPQGRLHNSLVMRAVTDGQKLTLEGTGSARRDSTTAVNRQTYKNLTGRMLELQTGVDGLKVTAAELSGAYTELNLTVEGLSTKTVDIEGNYSALTQTVDGITSEVSALSGAYSTLSQTVDGISGEVAGKIGEERANALIQLGLEGLSLEVVNGVAKSVLRLKSGSTILSSGDIQVTGMVTFNDLKGNGTTVINGNNITTGTLNADLIKTGTIASTSGNTEYDLTTGAIRSGPSAGTRFEIDSKKINWYIEQDGTSYLTGVLYSLYGKTYIGANSRYTFFGWMSRGNPSFNYSSSGATSTFVGLAVDQQEKLIHCNAAKFEIPGRIECSSLSVNGKEITG